MTSASGVIYHWDTLQAYCRQIGLPGLESELATELETRGYGKVVERNGDDKR